MQLTRFTDYALRALIYLAQRPDRRCSIQEIASAYAISEHYLAKIAHALGRAGFLKTVRGRGGGICLAQPASAIRVGDVVRHMERCDAVAECDSCTLATECRLIGPLERAMAAFLLSLDDFTLADVLPSAACEPALPLLARH